jgi:hypothetical protein
LLVVGRYVESPYEVEESVYEVDEGAGADPEYDEPDDEPDLGSVS